MDLVRRRLAKGFPVLKFSLLSTWVYNRTFGWLTRSKKISSLEFSIYYANTAGSEVFQLEFRTGNDERNVICERDSFRNLYPITVLTNPYGFPEEKEWYEYENIRRRTFRF